MKSLSDTLNYILASTAVVQDTVELSLPSAAGAFLACDIVSPVSVPPADNSAMDGYALWLEPVGSPATPDTWYPISQTINAGSVGGQLAPDQAARIFTGAEIPPGANTVAMQENCELSADGKLVRVHSTNTGDNIRRAGQDIEQDAVLFQRGHRLTPVDIGLLASIGLATVTVFRPLRVAILSTGDELVEPGQPLAPGQIYNSNRYLLMSALQALHCEPVDLGQVADDLASTEQALLQGAGCDLIITTGGVSVGEADFVKTAIENLGQLETWKLAIKPGKPLAFGHIISPQQSGQSDIKTALLGLPGNPVAVLVTFLLVVKPFLNSLRCAATQQPARLFPAGFSTRRTASRSQYLRIKIDDRGRVVRYGNQSSGVLSSVSWADGLAVIERDTTVQEGQLVPVILLNDHLLN